MLVYSAGEPLFVNVCNDKIVEHTTFRTRRKFEIKTVVFFLEYDIYFINWTRTDFAPQIKVKESLNRPAVAQRVPGGLGCQISMTFGT